MNRRYIDFVPANNLPADHQPDVIMPATPKRRMPRSGVNTVVIKRQTVRTDVISAKPVHTQPAKHTTATRGTYYYASTSQALPVEQPAPLPHQSNNISFSGGNSPRLGEVEDLQSRFVRSDVPKRPLGQASHFKPQKTGASLAKAEKVGNKRRTSVKSVEKSVEKPTKNTKSTSSKPSDNTYHPPKTRFVNTAKVPKRPLSKNVYSAKPKTPAKNESKGPVTIIAKPEKDTRAGTIVAIIITIILGAAAGTVAFLLLPK